MIAVYLFGILIASLVLIKAADITVTAISKLSKSTHVGSFFLSAIVLAIGTSLPEFFVALTSSLGGSPNLSLGNVIGANITNVTLISAVGAIIFVSVNVKGQMLKKDLGVALISGIAPFLLIFDGELSRVDGLILLSIYGVYASSLFRNRYMDIARERIGKEDEVVSKVFREIAVVSKNNYQNFTKLFGGIALLLFSAQIIVTMADSLAKILDIPLFLVGLIILSLGTTLPELAFSIRSLRDHHPTMFFGNLLGSVIANSTLVVGTASLISPIRVVAIENYLVAFVTFCVSFLLFYVFTKSKHTLSRWEGMVLLAVYIIFVIIEFS